MFHLCEKLKVEILADKNGGLMRLLGVELGAPDATSEPRCQRFAGIVEDGILLKLVRTNDARLAPHMPFLSAPFPEITEPLTVIIGSHMRREWSNSQPSCGCLMHRACSSSGNAYTRLQQPRLKLD